MTIPPHDKSSELLSRMTQGDAGAAEELLPQLYDELRRIAEGLMRNERDAHTLQPTALIGEAALRLLGSDNQDFEGRAHFLRVAARAMRNVLVDHARGRGASKRGGGGGAKVTLDEGLAFAADQAASLLIVDETLRRLSQVDPQMGQVVELRFFGGLKDAEVAAALGISERTVQRDWRMARAWLTKEMVQEGAAES